ncbi:hypothetical protein V494_07969, partial [Pseudogymnoascus sp. VKM F-4513 (FW-928)]
MASLTDTNAIEEETYDDYTASEFYPAHVGEVIKSPTQGGGAYELLGKLGFGRHSTVWLCRGIDRDREASDEDATFYTLKISIVHDAGTPNREADIYTHIQSLSSPHEGRAYIRNLHEAFELEGPEEGGARRKHWCLVHAPLGISLRDYQDTFPGSRYPVGVLKGVVRRLLHALDFLHREAAVIHTDIQPSNVLLALPPRTEGGEEAIRAFVDAERENPAP